MNTTTDIKLAPASQPTAPDAHPVKLWASGGCTGYSDYLMSDGTIKTLKSSEPYCGSINPTN